MAHESSRRHRRTCVTSVDHALRAAVMLQMEGPLTVSQVAERLGVARSTAHRLLSTLVYRDFAVQDDERSTTPVRCSQLAPALAVGDVPAAGGRASATCGSWSTCWRRPPTSPSAPGPRPRFVASVECTQALRVGSREGMVFPAHRTTGGLVLLAALDPEAVRSALPGRGLCRPTGGAPGPRPARERAGTGAEVGLRRQQRALGARHRRRRRAGAGWRRCPGRGPVGVVPECQVRPAPAARARGGAAAGSRCGRGGTRRLTLRGQWLSGRALPPPAPRMRRSPRPAEQDEGSEPESGGTQMS